MAASTNDKDEILRSDWMSELPSNLHNLPLNKLSIPGSHNSGSYWLDLDGAISPSCPPLVSSICTLLGPGARQILYKWSVCQSHTITQQLEAGIRYLDLRLASKPGFSDLYFEHGLYGGSVNTSLKDISQFIREHPKEIVLLDFNHFSNVTDEQHIALIDMIKHVFGSRLCAISDVSTLTLTRMWEADLQVIVFYHHDLAYENPELWPGSFIPSPWPQAGDVETLMTLLETKASQGLPEDKFHVTQCVITASLEHIMANLASNLRDVIAAKVAPRALQYIAARRRAKQRINICIIDFVELDGFISSMIGLNSCS